jgi:hypothetical protein
MKDLYVFLNPCLSDFAEKRPFSVSVSTCFFRNEPFFMEGGCRLSSSGREACRGSDRAALLRFFPFNPPPAFTSAWRMWSRSISTRALMAFRRLKGFSALNDSYQNHDNRDHQQNMDKPAHRVTAHQSQQPQNYQYHSDRPQHIILLLICLRFALDGLEKVRTCHPERREGLSAAWKTTISRFIRNDELDIFDFITHASLFIL